MRRGILGFFAGILLAACSSALAAPYELEVLYHFKDGRVMHDSGGGPLGGVSFGPGGLLYGTTFRGGAFVQGPFGTWVQTGVAYSFDLQSGIHTVLGSFETAASAVPRPHSNMIPDSAGNLFGTTSAGGSSGHGSIYKISTDTRTLSTLASFPVGHLNSHGGLVSDDAGFLYGASTLGIYRVNIATGTLTMLATFPSSAGFDSYGNLYRDANGNLYGTNSSGGTHGHGAVFMMNAATNQIMTLMAFNDTNGATPRGGLAAGKDGKLYGTTSSGGSNRTGTIYRLDPLTGDIETVQNAGGSSTLVMDHDGTFYGASGSSIFHFDPITNARTIVATFNEATGFSVNGDLLLDGNGNLFGTTNTGGAHVGGTLFKLTIPEPSTSLFLLTMALLRRRSITAESHR